MGSLCARADCIQSVPCAPRYSFSPVRTRKTVRCPEELYFAPGTFIRENPHPFTEIYTLDNNIIGSGIGTEIRTCTHKITKATRVVKIVNKFEFPLSLQRTRSLLREVKILKDLDHPHILRIYEFFESDFNFFIVMEYCTGGSLFQEVLKLNLFSEKRASHIMQQILSAVAYLHARNIVHRDLKPENILIDSRSGSDEELFIKIIDFDIATYFDLKTRLKGSFGTIYYMAPEVFSGTYDEKCDLWSIGVILYILLCGYPPFDGDNDQEIANKIQKGSYRMKGGVWNQISNEAKDLISRLLIKNPDQRISARDGFSHPWISNYADEKRRNSVYLSHVLDNIRQFNKSTKLKEAFDTFIVTQVMRPEDLKDQRLIFHNLDTNGDGVISRQELERWYLDFMPENEVRVLVDKIMQHVDSDNNGVIDYTEFLRATVDMKKLLSEQNLINTFQLFDIDNSGTISKNELKSRLCDEESVDDRIIEALLKEADKDGDGEIGFVELKMCMA